AVAPPEIPTAINTLAVVLKPGPDPPAKLVCVIIALAVWPAYDAVTRICIWPETLLRRIPTAVAWACASVVMVSVLVPLAKTPPGPWFGKKKVTAAPGMGR